MKKVYNFSKFFVPAVILSVVLIAAGLISSLTKGFNKGLDFAPGQTIDVTIGSEEKLSAEDVKAVLDAAELGIKYDVKAVENDGKVFYQVRTQLIEEEAPAAETAETAETAPVDANAAAEVNKDSETMNKDEAAILKALSVKYGADKVAEIQKTTITAQYSSTLIKNSIYLVLATLVIIFIYSAFRFKWDFGLAAVIAIIHDAFIMVGFISITGLEFTTTTIAAVLTIIGYSINATVVILDRVRTDVKNPAYKNFKEVMNASLSGTLSRSIITTVTTLFAVVSLAVIVKTGDIHNFAIALIVGLVSGCYSSMFIAGAFISFVRSGWKPAVSNSNVVKFEE